MEINVNERIKLAEIWLTNEDQTNPEIKEKVNCIVQDFKKSKFKTAIFYSGQKNLLSCTENLIRCNFH